MTSATLEETLNWNIVSSGTPELETERDQEERHTAKLLVRAKSGCMASFEQIVGRYEERIYNYVNTLAGNAHDAQDITQETFIKVYRNLHRHSKAHSFSPWLFTIAKRTALNTFRKRRPTTEFVEYTEVENEDPSVTLSQKERSESFWKLTEKLKPVQREVLWLRYGEGFSIEETAEIVRKTQLYVRVTLHRSRNELAKHLKKFTESTE